MQYEFNKVYSVCIVELIAVKGARGDGTLSAPVRTVTEYWTKNGKKIAQIDDIEREERNDQTT